jgi:hypothetical protein
LKIWEFFNNFYLHDSLMESISYEETKLVFDINLCWWKQREYKPNDDEIKKIRLIFNKINDFDFEGENRKVDSDTILEFSVPESDGNNEYPVIKVVFGDGNDIKIIRFRANSVDLSWV